MDELLGAITVNYRHVDYNVHFDCYSGKNFYIMDREMIRHLAYE